MEHSACPSARTSLWLYVLLLATLSPSTCEGKMFVVKENSLEGTLVSDLIEDYNIVLEEQHRRSDLQFVISSYEDHFAISEGKLRCSGVALDREKLCRPNQVPCRKDFRVTLVSPKQYFRNIDLEIEVEDENDNAPVFGSASFQINVTENVQVGSSYSLPPATDRDVGINDIQFYRISGEDGDRDEGPSFPFELQMKSTNGRAKKQASLRVRSQLDREAVASYRFRLEAVDGGQPEPKTGTMTVVVNVVDVNDNGPIFQESSYRVVVEENFPIGGVIVTVEATDADEGDNGQIRYQLVPGQWEEERTFRLDEQSGQLFLVRPLDHSRMASYSVEIMASDMGPEARENFTRVEITIEDINDNAPQLVLNPLVEGRAATCENVEAGHFVVHLLAKDADSGDNGRVNCSVSRSFPEEGAFSLESLGNNEFRLVTASSGIDREVVPSHRVVVACHDFGLPRRMTSTLEVDVNIIDVDDNPPFFEKPAYLLEVEENNSIGQLLLQVKADDLDSGINASMRFSLCPESVDAMKGTVSVDQRSGRIFALESFDHEKRNEYLFCVAADNDVDDGGGGGGGGCLRHASTTTRVTTNVHLKILDRNDNAPQFMRKVYKFEIPENSPFSTEIGVLRAIDVDSEPFNEFEFFIQQQQQEMENQSRIPFLPFHIDQRSGKLITTASLDRESVTSYDFSVKAVDANDSSLSSAVSVEVKILDLNDNTPTFLENCREAKIDLGSYGDEVLELCRFVAFDPDEGDNGLVTYSMVRDQPHRIFNVSSREGALHLLTFGLIDAPSDLFVNSTAVLNVTILAKDNGRPQLSSLLRTTVEINLLPTFSLDALRERRDGYFAGRPLRIFALCACVVATLVALAVMVALLVVRRRRTSAGRRPRYDVKAKQEKFIVPRDLSSDDCTDETDRLKSLNNDDGSNSSNNVNNNKTIIAYPPSQKFYEEEGGGEEKRDQTLKYDFSDPADSSQVKKKGKSSDNNQYFSLTKKRKGSITDRHQDKRDVIYKPSADPPKKQPVFFKPQISTDEPGLGPTESERNLHSPAFNQGTKVSANVALWKGPSPNRNSFNSGGSSSRPGEPGAERQSISPSADARYPYSKVSTFFEYQNQSNKTNVANEAEGQTDSKNIYY